MKQRIFPTYTSRSPWSLELQRNLMFAASSGVIMRSEIFSMDSWVRFYKIIGCRGGGGRTPEV